MGARPVNVDAGSADAGSAAAPVPQEDAEQLSVMQ